MCVSVCLSVCAVTIKTPTLSNKKKRKCRCWALVSRSPLQASAASPWGRRGKQPREKGTMETTLPAGAREGNATETRQVKSRGMAV